MRSFKSNLKLFPSVLLVFAMTWGVTLAQRTILVIGDGPPFPGAVSTIQDGVSTATAGSTIIVFPAVYKGTVNIIGHDKDGLKVVAAGGPDAVILQGDHTQRDGFHLEEVNGVLIQGFTVRDFGMNPTTDMMFGVGTDIILRRANKNTIRSNIVTGSDMMGVDLRDSSSDNVIEHNLSYNNDKFPKGAACGIMISGAGSARNVVRHNEVYGNDITGVMILNAGADNVVSDNTFNTLNGNGTFGITVANSNGTRVVGNRTQGQRGRFSGPDPIRFPIGIGVQTSTGVVVSDNIASDNAGFEILWDNRGQNTFTENGRLKPLKPLSLTNTTSASRNPDFLVGDAFRVEVNDAPANVPVYMRIVKDGTFLGTSGPYGNPTDSLGRWSLSGTFPSEGVGSWLVQLLFGGPDSPQQTSVVTINIKKPGQALAVINPLAVEPHCGHDDH